jgi:enoyl-CoA hydratase
LVHRVSKPKRFKKPNSLKSAKGSRSEVHEINSKAAGFLSRPAAFFIRIFPLASRDRFINDGRFHAGQWTMSDQSMDGSTERTFENVLYSVRGPLALITINRPEKHNAISLATLDDLHGAVDEAAYDDEVRVIAITGAGGKAFAAGSDLSEVIDRDFKKALEPIVQGLADKLERTPKPTIAAIDGICMGGGLEVALGCDLRVATPQSRFATPEGKLGIIPGGGATARLPRVVGRGWGMEMMLMGEPIGAERALQIGLVTRLVESDQLMGEIQKMAEHLASFAPFVPRTMKAMVHFGMEASLAGALMFEKYAQGALVQTQDKAEGINAFLEKRTPDFKGR